MRNTFVDRQQTELNATDKSDGIQCSVFQLSPPSAFVSPPKYRLLCYRWDYINGEHNTPGPHVHTPTIYYETLDKAALKSRLESVVLSRPRQQRGMDSQVIKGSYLGFCQCHGCVFLISYLFECGNFYDGV